MMYKLYKTSREHHVHCYMEIKSSFDELKEEVLKDTHKDKTPSYKTPALRKNTNMCVWAVGTLNQLFI